MDSWDEVFMDFKLVLNIVCPLIRFGWTMLSLSWGTLFSQRLATRAGWASLAFHSHMAGQALPAGHCGGLTSSLKDVCDTRIPSSALPQPPPACLGTWCLSAANCAPPFFPRHMLECLYCLQSVLPLVLCRSKHPWCRSQTRYT